MTKQIMQNKYFKYLLIALIIAFVVPQITLAAWWNPFSWGFWNSLFHKQTPTTQVVCTKEAKLCPDGLTTVGRQGPKCAFAECPKISEQYSCQADTDCVSSCKWGGVNRIWYEKNKTQDCIDGCAGIGFEVKCADKICHNLLDGKLNDSGCSERDKKYINNSSNNNQLIGGDKDSHGCLAGAGYTWCEAKNKCLRVWEEKCETDTTANWKTYTNTQYGFEVKYPTDWQVSEGAPGAVPLINGTYFSIFSTQKDSLGISLYKIIFSVRPTTLNNNNELLAQTIKYIESNSNIKNTWKASETNLLNVENAVTITDSEDAKCPIVNIEAINNHYLFKFDPICNINKNETNILKTFKFTK